jgi:uncharacterized protein DUF3152
MIDVRRWWIASALVLTLLLTGGWLLPRLTRANPEVAWPVRPSAAPSAAPALPPAAAPAPAPISATSKAVPVDLLTMPGRPPTRGTGKFGYAAGTGKVLGSRGPVRRFRVAVERGSGEDVAVFAAQVEATLGDRRSWVGGGGLRMRRVDGGTRSDFTVYLVTRDTAGLMCANGGVNIRVGGRPYTSCRSTGKVIINLDRWRLSAKPYLSAKVPLISYRQYVINHEVGHELGHSHQGCPKRGRPAPVMAQQTLTLGGCTPHAWPRR